MDNYYELKVQINADMAEVLSDIFFEQFDCEGVISAEETYKDLEMISTTEGTLKVFLKPNDDINEENIANKLNEIREVLMNRGLSEEELGSWEFSLKEIQNQDWSKKWKENWDVTKVTDKITIVPTWINYNAKAGEVVVNLDPGCAFGTGTHETTQLCMRAMEKYLNSEDKVADIGMGSGILSICAKKLGASYAYGCDNDETVIDVAKENAFLNKEECVFELNTADKVSETFDFVCANILHNVLAEIMGDLKSLMKNDAKMVLSGILNEKKPVVLEAIKREELEIVEQLTQNQWVAFVVKRK